MKCKATGLSGIMLIDKPVGITSHDCIDRIRRLTGERRVGHAGTLDPAASGALIVCMGPATRLSNYLMGHDKRYEARIVFGCRTDTDDAEGDVIEEKPVPAEISDDAFARESLKLIEAMKQQTPPMYSAIKRDGKRMYEVARSGGAVELEPRPISVCDVELLDVGVVEEPEGTSAGRCYWDLAMTVSKGTYVRSIARDMGDALGTCAHLGALRRIRCGNVCIQDAVGFDEIEAAGFAFRASNSADAFDDVLLDPTQTLGFQTVVVDSEVAEAVFQGKRIPLEACQVMSSPMTGELVSIIHNNRILGIHEVRGGHLVARCVIPGGVAGCRKN